MSFDTGYRRALASGIDPLEALDAIYECPHGHLHGDGCHLCTPAPANLVPLPAGQLELTLEQAA
ncbi:MAG TPA: hypothetical protein VF069_27510 [Streptosporangiaceae bacterium]